MRRRYGILLLGICASTCLALGCRLTQPTDEFPMTPAPADHPRPSFATDPVSTIEPPPPVSIPDPVLQKATPIEMAKPFEPLPVPQTPVLSVQGPPDPPTVTALRELIADHPDLAQGAAISGRCRSRATEQLVGAERSSEREVAPQHERDGGAEETEKRLVGDITCAIASDARRGDVLRRGQELRSLQTACRSAGISVRYGRSMWRADAPLY